MPAAPSAQTALQPHVLTMIAPTDGPILTNGDIDQARDILASGGAEPAAPVWLATGRAADLAFWPGRGDPAATLKDLSTVMSVDIAVQPTEGRRKRLLIADMDSTMIAVECLDEIADLIGVKEQVATITEQAMRGDLDFEEALKERVALLKGLDHAALLDVYKERVRFTPGADVLIATLKAHGVFTALVSGGFTFFTDRVAQDLGFDWSQANALEAGADGKLTGTVRPPILGREAKAQALRALCDIQGLEPRDAMALGDGANDLAMIDAAGLGIAYRAKPVVAEQADARIDHADLTGVLFIQGYPAEAFVRP